jgi:chromosome segregation ATPase
MFAAMRLKLAFSCALLLAVPSQAADLYRYVNKDGVTVIDYQVPAELIGNGYEIINETGDVLEVVPRILSDEELAARSEQEKQAAETAAAEERQRKWDESLMLRYSSVEDIEDARERALRNLRIRVSILRSNLRALKQQVENYQAEAADLERSGREVDLARLSAMEDLRAEISSTERSIDDREQEIAAVSDEFQRDIERFEELLEIVELRRSYSVSPRQ